MKKIKFISLLLLSIVFLCSCALGWTNHENDGYGDIYIDQNSGEYSESIDGSSCEDGLTNCGGFCVNLSSNHENCGSCGNACPEIQVCNNGECKYECPPGKVACSGVCTDVKTDILNCGNCAVKCSAGLHAKPECVNGTCQVVCDSGWSDLNGDGSCETNCVPSSESEICNGIDDNCDGRIDEAFECALGREVSCTTICGTNGRGICGVECRIPSGSSCTPQGEICNGVDDNCNNEVDDGFECPMGERTSCTTPCGTTGEKVCSATCFWSNCVPPSEICNGVDDNCDTICDNGLGLACCANQMQEENCGNCGRHTRTCLNNCTWGPWGSCTGEGECQPGATRSCGRCGIQTCSSSCTWGTCTGEGVCSPGEVSSCTTSCGTTGTKTCSPTCTWGSCVPPEETLNFRDDNCNGTVDEGYSLIARGYNDCDGTGASCPSGYYATGCFKVDSISCSGSGETGVDYSGYVMRAGWMCLCSPTNDVILAKGWDDCTGTGGGCPSGYSDRGSFKVDSGSCSGGITGSTYDGQELRSGWLHLCSRTGIESLQLWFDNCTGSSGVSCPTGTTARGRWKPDVVACNPSWPSAVTATGYSLNNGWIQYCSKN